MLRDVCKKNPRLAVIALACGAAALGVVGVLVGAYFWRKQTTNHQCVPVAQGAQLSGVPVATAVVVELEAVPTAKVAKVDT